MDKNSGQSTRDLRLEVRQAWVAMQPGLFDPWQAASPSTLQSPFCKARFQVCPPQGHHGAWMQVSLQALSTLGFSGPCDEQRLLGLQGGTGPTAVGCRLVPPRDQQHLLLPDALAAERPEDVEISSSLCPATAQVTEGNSRLWVSQRSHADLVLGTAGS